MNVDHVIARACEQVPGMLRAVLVLVPDGILLGAVGDVTALDLEPLIRSTGRCLAPVDANGTTSFVESVFVISDQLVVIARGRREPRIALAIVSSREPNLAFVLATTRLALSDVETTVDLASWGL